MLLWSLMYKRLLFSLKWVSCWVAQTNLKLGILLPWSPKGWDPWCKPICLASLYLFLCEQMLLILLRECPRTESGSNGSSQFKVLKNYQAILTSNFAILHSNRKMCGGFESWPLAHFPYGHSPDTPDIIVNSKCWLVAFLVYISLMMDGVNVFSYTHWLFVYLLWIIIYSNVSTNFQLDFFSALLLSCSGS